MFKFVYFQKLVKSSLCYIQVMEVTIPEFGIRRKNEERRDGGCGIVYDPVTKQFAVNLHKSGLIGLFGGGVDEDEDIEAGVLREVIEESGLDDFMHVEGIAEAITHYHNILKKEAILLLPRFLVIVSSQKKDSKG